MADQHKYIFIDWCRLNHCEITLGTGSESAHTDSTISSNLEQDCSTKPQNRACHNNPSTMPAPRFSIRWTHTSIAFATSTRSLLPINFPPSRNCPLHRVNQFKKWTYEELQPVYKLEDLSNEILTEFYNGPKWFMARQYEYLMMD